MTQTHTSDPLIAEFKDLIKQITVEVSKQGVVQEIKRSEETMKQSSSQIAPLAAKLRESSAKLEALLDSNAKAVSSIYQRLTNLENALRESAGSLVDKGDVSHKQITKLINENTSSLRATFQNASDAALRANTDRFDALARMLEEERVRTRTARRWLFTLLGLQLVLVAALPAAVYMLLK